MAERKQNILETVMEDSKGAKDMKLNSRPTTLAKAKKKRRVGESVSSKPKHVHHRVVTADVSTTILDHIKEEPDITAETPENNNSNEEETKVKINKILVRTPLVGIDNGTDRADSDLTCDDINSNEPDKTNSNDTNNQNSPPNGKPLEREVSFGVKSEKSSSPNPRSTSKKFKRPKSCRRFTKEDLELFLPRKSFFNSHDKILVEAGHQVDTHKERKKPNWHAILKMHTQEELYPVKKEEPTDNEHMFGALDDDTESEDELFSLEKTETLLSKEGTKKKSKSSSKKAGNPEREEYKPLYEYLKYIHDNPDEYVSLTKFTTKNLEHKHPNTMVRMGRVFRRGSNVRNSIYLHALCGLKSSGQEQTNTQDESEIVKLKTKAEAWLKGQTTQQYLKAKELVLKDVGEEDISNTKWWLAFKSCQYLRVPKHVTS